MSLTLIDLQAFRCTHSTSDASLGNAKNKPLHSSSFQSDVILGVSSLLNSFHTNRNDGCELVRPFFYVSSFPLVQQP
eukprot:4856884-Amphidinium_carterae.1